MVCGAAVAFVAAGCAQPPAAEVGLAEAALTAAQGAEAETYAADAFKAAQDTQAQLQAELTAQQQKFGLLCLYSKATQLAAAAKTAAEKAQQDAGTEKERVRTGDDAANRQRENRSRRGHQAPRERRLAAKDSRADIAAMKADSAAVTTSLGEADTALGASQFAEARSKAQAALDAAGKVKTSVEEAQAARKGARPRA